jgi:hypothetical protein
VRTQAKLEVSRVDGRVLHLKLGDRVVRMEGSRLTISDPGNNRLLRWSFPPTTTITATPKGFSASTPLGDMSIVAGSGWMVDEHSIVHRGCQQPHKVKIELK